MDVFRWLLVQERAPLQHSRRQPIANRGRQPFDHGLEQLVTDIPMQIDSIGGDQSYEAFAHISLGHNSYEGFSNEDTDFSATGRTSTYR